MLSEAWQIIAVGFVREQHRVWRIDWIIRAYGRYRCPLWIAHRENQAWSNCQQPRYFCPDLAFQLRLNNSRKTCHNESSGKRPKRHWYTSMNAHVNTNCIIYKKFLYEVFQSGTSKLYLQQIIS
jgi:hypothetical protein